MEYLAIFIIKNSTISRDIYSFDNIFNRTGTETRPINLGSYLVPTWHPFQQTDITETETSSELPNNEGSAVQVVYDSNLVDQFGWVKLTNRKFYNVVTNVVQSAHLFLVQLFNKKYCFNESFVTCGVFLKAKQPFFEIHKVA